MTGWRKANSDIINHYELKLQRDQFHSFPHVKRTNKRYKNLWLSWVFNTATVVLSSDPKTRAVYIQKFAVSFSAAVQLLEEIETAHSNIFLSVPENEWELNVCPHPFFLLPLQLSVTLLFYTHPFKQFS